MRKQEYEAKRKEFEETRKAKKKTGEPKKRKKKKQQAQQGPADGEQLLAPGQGQLSSMEEPAPIPPPPPPPPPTVDPGPTPAPVVPAQPQPKKRQRKSKAKSADASKDSDKDAKLEGFYGNLRSLPVVPLQEPRVASFFSISPVHGSATILTGESAVITQSGCVYWNRAVWPSVCNNVSTLSQTTERISLKLQVHIDDAYVI